MTATVPLKVRDLIEQLQDHDPDAEVCIRDIITGRGVSAYRLQIEPSSVGTLPKRVELSNRIGRWD